MAEDIDRLMIERGARGLYFTSVGAHYAEQFRDEIWAGSLGLTDDDREEEGSEDEPYGILIRGRNFYRRQALAALLAALDPSDEVLVRAVARVLPNGVHDARAAIVAIRTHAQGER